MKYRHMRKVLLLTSVGLLAAGAAASAEHDVNDEDATANDVDIMSGGSDLLTLQSKLQQALIAIATLQTDLADEIAARAAADSRHDTSLEALESNSVLELNNILTLSGTTALFEGVNVQIVNGLGATDGTPNGSGNLIVGYNAVDTGAPLCSWGFYEDQSTCEGNGGVWAASHKSGSHNVVIGDLHNYSRSSGLVVGLNNNIVGEQTTVCGGISNTAAGDQFDSRGATVAGGTGNRASGVVAFVAGGSTNTAYGGEAVVLGGKSNDAGGDGSAVVGGAGNFAGLTSAVLGGDSNAAVIFATVVGGSSNYADLGSVVSGGRDNQAIGPNSTVSGGTLNRADGEYASVSGGRNNHASGLEASVSGGDDIVCTSDTCGEGTFAPPD